jgi:poly(A) polymerase
MRPHSALQMKPATLKRLCRIPHFEEFLELHRLDCVCSNGNMETYDFLWKFYQEHKHEIEVTPLLTGYHLLALGFKPGPIYKKVLEAVETKQLNGELKTTGEAVDFVNVYKQEVLNGMFAL